MISLHSIIKTTTPNMNLRNVQPSIMNINAPLMGSQTARVLGTNMFERINIAQHKCASCPNAR